MLVPPEQQGFWENKKSSNFPLDRFTIREKCSLDREN
jgi:hypothetical protein